MKENSNQKYWLIIIVLFEFPDIFKRKYFSLIFPGKTLTLYKHFLIISKVIYKDACYHEEKYMKNKLQIFDNWFLVKISTIIKKKTMLKFFSKLSVDITEKSCLCFKK